MTEGAQGGEPVLPIPSAFQISEVMKGDHHFVDPDLGSAVDHLFYFRIDWRGSIPGGLNPKSDEFLLFQASGTIFVGGLTPGEVPCVGTIRVDYLQSKTIRYELDFELDGEPYSFVGEKVDVELHKPALLIKTHTTCYGTLAKGDGTIVSRSVTHFEPQRLLPFLLSFRLK
jgi:hypothetical protein